MDNDRLTVWGQSYEKEMKAHHKSDTTIPSQMDISVSIVDATKALPPTIANKENVVPSRRVQHSIAFLEDENSELRSPERTLLHVHPTDNLSGEDGLGGKEIFQLKSFVANVPNAIAEQRLSVNDSAGMEVSMIWQDILAQSKIASVRNKTASKMGNTINLVSDSDMMLEGRQATPRQTIHYQADDGQMEESLAAINRTVPLVKEFVLVDSHQVIGAIAKPRQTIHYQADDGQMDESLAVTQANIRLHGQAIGNPRQTIHFSGQTGVMDESLWADKSSAPPSQHAEGILEESTQPKNFHQPINLKSQEDGIYEQSRNTRQTIHFNQHNGAMDESLVRNNGPNISRGTKEWTQNKRKQTIHFRDDEAALEETLAPVMPSRNTIYFTPSSGEMDESLHVNGYPHHDDMEVEEGPQKTPGKRGTIYFRDEHAALDVTKTASAQLQQTVCDEGGMNFSQIEVLQNIPSAEKELRSRQTVYYQEQDIALDVSSQVSTIVQNVPRRETVYYSAEQGLMEESSVMPHPKLEHFAKPQTDKPHRSTIYYHEPQQTQLDESLNMEIGKLQKKRHTIYDNKGMDISVNDVKISPDSLPVNEAAEEIRYRPTVYYRDTDAGLDLSCVDKKQSPTRRTILFNREGGGMEESMVMATPKEQSVAMSVIQQQHPNNYYHPEQTQRDVSLMLGGEATSTKPLQPRGLKLRQTIYDHGVMDISLCVNKGNVHVIAPIQHISTPTVKPMPTAYFPVSEEELDVSKVSPSRDSHQSTVENVVAAPRRQTIHFNREDDGMEESLMMVRDPVISNSVGPVKERPIGPLELSRTRAARNISLVAPMEETVIVPNIRRSTFNVPPEEARVPLKSYRLQGTISEGESMVSDLNNFEDSIELIDSNGNAPTGPNVTQRMSLQSPDVTVHDLNLNFNVTGQIVVPKEDEAAEQEEEWKKNAEVVSKSSRIPVAKALRTPRKELRRDAISDHSTVDLVCRDAIPAMSTFAELNVDEETHAIFRAKPDPRLSIPVFSGMQDNVLRQTMLNMNDVTEFDPDMDDEEEEKESGQQQETDQGTVEVAIHRQLNIDKFKNFDYGVGVRLMKNLRYKVASILNATPVDQSVVYMAKPIEEMSLRQRVMNEIEE